MTDPTPALSPSGEPAAPEHVGVAFRAILFGTTAGTGLVAAAMWGVRTLQLQYPSTTAATGGPIFALGVGGTLAGLLLASGLAWSLMRPLRSSFRRGGFAVIAGFATIILMLLTIAVDVIGGRWALLGFAALCALGCLLLARRVAVGFRA